MCGIGHVLRQSSGTCELHSRQQCVSLPAARVGPDTEGACAECSPGAPVLSAHCQSHVPVAHLIWFSEAGSTLPFFRGTLCERQSMLM